LPYQMGGQAWACARNPRRAFDLMIASGLEAVATFRA